MTWNDKGFIVLLTVPYLLLGLLVLINQKKLHLPFLLKFILALAYLVFLFIILTILLFGMNS